MSEIISPESLGIRYSGRGGYDFIFRKLTSLKGCPEKIRGYFNISYNEITSLKYSPLFVGEFFNCSFNPIDFFDMPNIVVGLDFFFNFKQTQIYEIKNINKLLSNVDLKMGDFRSKVVLNDGDRVIHFLGFEQMLNSLRKRKKAGEDIEQLYVEGMNWCWDQGYPEDFWGDM